MKILSVSPVLPLKNPGHAGGKTYFYYITHLCKCEKADDVRILAFANRAQVLSWNGESLAEHTQVVLTSGTVVSTVKHAVFDLIGKLGWYGSCGASYYKFYEIMKYLADCDKKSNLPDLIELEWTDFVLFAGKIKKKYPNILIAASEHDVSFLGAYRQYQLAEKNRRKKLKRRYELLRKQELEALKACDLIFPQNEKDKKLLVENGIQESKIRPIVPYYHSMEHIVRSSPNHDILFWGAMYREENYRAAIWFIDEVMPLLADTDVHFVVAGNRPPKILEDKASERVIITGFVEDETPLFEHSLCFVSPLFMGAGIKVKVIEAFSAGIPVLTNEVGIEGIPGEDKKTYFHCNTAQDYADAIQKLLSDEETGIKMGRAQHELMRTAFNLEQSADQYVKDLKQLKRV